MRLRALSAAALVALVSAAGCSGPGPRPTGAPTPGDVRARVAGRGGEALRAVCRELGFETGLFGPERTLSAGTCAAAPVTILAVTDELRWDWLFLVFDDIRFRGYVECGWQKGESPSLEIVSAPGGAIFLVLRSRTFSGTGADRHSELWYDLAAVREAAAPRALRASLALPARGHVAGWGPAAVDRRFEARLARRVLPSGALAVDADYEIEVAGAPPVTRHARFVWEGRFRLDPAASNTTKAEIDGLFDDPVPLAGSPPGAPR